MGFAGQLFDKGMTPQQSIDGTLKRIGETDHIRENIRNQRESRNTNTNSSVTRNRPRGGSGGGRFQSYRYPNKMLTSSTDYLKIKVVKYIPADHGKDNKGGTGNVGGKEGNVSGKQTVMQRASAGFSMPTISERVKKQSPLAQIILPIPQTITDSNNVKWGDDEMNPLQALGAKLGRNLMTDPGKVFEGVKGTEGFGTIDQSTKDAVMSALTGAAVGKGANAMIARSTGQVMNPNMEVIFDGVTIRTFTFDFEFAPRNMSEANQVKQIIRLFKKHSAAKFESGNGFYIASPDIFTFEYMKGRSAHPFLNVFKPMVINKIDTDYTGNGTYSTYPDGTPTFIKMTLNVQEMNPIYAEHYDDGEGKRGVGF